jgi:hypothetical protein
MPKIGVDVTKTVYEIIADPPSLLGGVKKIVASSGLFDTAVTFNGGDGTLL